MFLLSFLGLALTLAGIYVMYVYIVSINTEANILFLFLSLGLIGGGVVLLVFAGKSDTMILKRVSRPEKYISTAMQTPPSEAGLANKLEQDNALLKDWKKTNETKERLRMLEMSAQAEEG